MSVTKYATTEDIQEAGKRSSNFSGPKIQDLLLELKPDGKDPVTKTVRLVGMPMLFTQYSPYKYTADRKARVACPFPDAEERKGYYRRGVEDHQVEEYGPCPYKAEGYIGQKRAAQVCLDQNEDGTWSVRILDKPKSLFDIFANFEKASKERNAKRGKNTMVTCLGGTKSHMVDVTARVGANDKVEYSALVIGNELVEMDDDQIEALRKCGEPTEEEYNSIIEANPSLAGAPKWFFYGPNLSRYFTPQLPKTAAATSGSATAQTFDEADLADVEPKQTKAAAASASSSTKASATTVTAETSMFDGVDKSSTDASTPEVNFEQNGW